jgi:hypothetical protein
MIMKSTEGGGVIATGAGVGYVRLASLRGMLKMEKVGLKGRMGPIRPRIAEEFGLKPRDSYDKFLNAVQAKMEEVAKVVQQENEAEAEAEAANGK